ncbi:hypothetical protein AZJ53_04390 [Streptococcus pneumoniae]|nr:hypothetical protein AZK25_00510 [Streptococcus pneumoniae]TVX09431.1 hypothetical protein AZJ53_04390 [Streptococcus pneumoniae]
MGLFFYNKIGSIISIVDLPTTNIIEPINLQEIRLGDQPFSKDKEKYEQKNKTDTDWTASVIAFVCRELLY